jgi:hypothetical protein
MKKILLILACAALHSFSLHAQKVSNYKELLKDAIPVTNPHWFDTPELRSSKDDENNTSSKPVNVLHLIALLRNDVVGYYNLERYNTELKKKMFANTAEGQSLAAEMKPLRTKIMEKQFYFLMDFNKSDKYDIGSKTFGTASTFFIEDTKIKKGYIYFETMFLSVPTGVQYLTEYTEEGNFPSACYQFLFIPVRNENAVMKIGKNMKNCSVLFLFRLKEVEKIGNSNYIFGTTQQLFIVNRETGEIYFELPKSQPKK